MRQALPFLVAPLLALTFLTLPDSPPDNEADPSLSAVLNYAHAHGLQYGTDIVYTYGPLGFLIFPCFSDHAAAARMATAVLLSCAVATGLCLVAWHLRVLLRCSLLLVFAWAAANIEHRLDLVLDTGFFCWGLLCFVESGRRLASCLLTFTALAAFAALAKGSFLFVATFSVFLLFVDLLTRREVRLSAALPPGFCAAFCVGWLFTGQNLLHLGAFFQNELAMVQGYNQALGWEGLEVARHLGLVLVLLAGTVVLLRTLTAFENSERRPRIRRAGLCLWVCFLTFTTWKHGFVRGDAYHAVFFLGFAPVVVLALDALPCMSRPAVWVTRTPGLVACLLALATLQILLFPPCHVSLPRPLASAWDNLCCLAAPGQYLHRMSGSLDAQRRAAQLPASRQLIGHATTDLFGQSQAFLLSNDLNYHPRPVFQSYAACTARLMRLNEQFLLSPAAPQFMLFELGALDRKFPTLEDARVLRDLLINYALAGTEGRFLLLKAKSTEPPRLTLLREGSVRASQTIDLAGHGNAGLWLEIELRPTLTGHLRQFLYRPSTVRLAAWGDDRHLLLRRRAPPSMLAAGFLVSPLLVRTEDVLNLYTTNTVPRPAACSVELLPGEERLWREDIHFRLSRIENPLAQQK